MANTQEEQVVRMDVDTILVMVEIPRGSRNKYEYDPETGRIVLDRMLFSAVHYPADYGFIPETLAEDGDPLDALVLVGEATFPGCLIRAKPIGVFHMWDEKGPDDKILAVPVGDPQWSWASDLDDVPEHLLREITHFFQVYKDLEHKKTKVGGWDNAEFARKVIREARERWEQQKKA
ncbi:MAG: inorganic diphosphatase [Limnochordales bacterium]